MSNPFFNATSYLNYSVGDGYVFAQLDGSSGTISFNQSYDVYFTVIGGGGGGGGGGHNVSSGTVSAPKYPSGGGGGAGSAGMVLYKVGSGEIYNYTIGAGGGGGKANLSGSNGQDTRLDFSSTDFAISHSGDGGTGHYNGNIGGFGGAQEKSGNVISVTDGVGGNGGDGIKYDNIPGTGTIGHDSNPPIIAISPTNTIYVGGGGGGTDASSSALPPPKPSNGGGGGNGSGGFVGTGETDGSGNGQVGVAYGAGGGGGGQPGNGSLEELGYPITSGGAGREGAIFIYVVNLTNGCQWNPLLANKTTLWTRATSGCLDLTDATLPDGQPMTRDDLSEKRKATIFQYKQNGAGFSKKQNYSRLARGLGRQRGQSFATQSDTYTNANTHGLPIVNNRVLSCSNFTKNWALTNQNDTPGPVRRITNIPTVPLTNYIVRRTYLAGGGKWPQYGWAPGNTGFPVGKKGNL